MKKSILTSILVFSLLMSFGQKIQKYYDYSDFDYVKDITTCVDGGYLILGYANSPLRSVLIKTDNQGDIIWEQFYTGNNFNKIEKSPDGYYLAGGKTNQSIAKILKVDMLGDTLWSKTYPEYLNGFLVPTYLIDVKRLNTGELILLRKYSWYDASLLIKTDSLGNIIWTKGTHGLSEIIQVENELAVSGSYFYETPDMFDDEMWPTLERYDLDGNNTFSSNYYYMNWAESSVLAYNDDNYYFTTSNDNYSLCKFSETDTVWTNKIAPDYFINSICIVNEELLLLPGRIRNGAASEYDLMILSLSSEGDSISIYTENEYYQQIGEKVIIDNDSIVLIGRVRQDGPINWNMYFLKMPLNYLLTGLNSEINYDKEFVTVYPNPFDNHINIKCTKIIDKQLLVNIYDMSGNNILQKEVDSLKGSILIECDDLKKGVYVVAFFSQGKLLETKKILKK